MMPSIKLHWFCRPCRKWHSRRVSERLVAVRCPFNMQRWIKNYRAKENPR